MTMAIDNPIAGIRQRAARYGNEALQNAINAGIAKAYDLVEDSLEGAIKPKKGAISSVAAKPLNYEDAAGKFIGVGYSAVGEPIYEKVGESYSKADIDGFQKLLNSNPFGELLSLADIAAQARQKVEEAKASAEAFANRTINNAIDRANAAANAVVGNAQTAVSNAVGSLGAELASDEIPFELPALEAPTLPTIPTIPSVNIDIDFSIPIPTLPSVGDLQSQLLSSLAPPSGIIPQETQSRMEPGELKISTKGLEFLIKHEGSRPDIYDDGFGYPTIGVGHLLLKDEKEKRQIKINGQYATPPLSDQQIQNLLRQDVQQFVDGVKGSVNVTLTQNQFDACVSLAFNIGVAGFRDSSVVKALNGNDFKDAPSAFMMWTKVKGQTVRGLVNRRVAEVKLFSTFSDGTDRV